jgi:pimeloyl-ACP methyl ester carboxylesterase
MPGLAVSGLPDLDRVDADALLARALLSLRTGRAARRASREVAVRYDFDALADADAALAALPDGPDRDPRVREARGIYNEALEDILRITGGRTLRLDEPWRNSLNAQGIRLTVETDGAVWSPDRFGEFLFADDYVVGGIGQQYRTQGIGVPLVAIREFRWNELGNRPGQDRFLMPREIYPATAVLRVVRSEDDRAGSAVEYRLELHDTIRTQDVAFGDRSEPLAIDLTTPLAYHFARSPMPILQEVGLLDPQWLEQLTGLYMLHPYEPGKIPIVLVHGLRSSPLAWLKVVNDLRGDPEIRDRFQFWLFMYPTGTPFPISATKLREQMYQLRDVVDPRHSDAMLDQTVLVGHSMGGLIAKMMILSSGDEAWKLISTRPFDDLQATPERREWLRNIFFFEPQSTVRRVVFIATPHRGSELGDAFIGRLADRLIRLPKALRSSYRDLMTGNDPDFFTDSIRSGLPSSIDQLRTDNRLLIALSRMARNPEVVCHSIIGRKDPRLPVEQSSDGVVPYNSSHIDWAASELVVPGDHGCQDIPATIRELRRILSIHLEQVDREARVEEPRGPVRAGRPDRARAKEDDRSS